MFWPVVKALLGHYRRHPFQILLVWLGLTLGISLFVGVLAINYHAKQSYAQGEKLFSNPLPYRIQPKLTSNKIPQGFYVQLRRNGFNQCVPFDTYRVVAKDGTQLNIVGFDPIAMMSLRSEKNADSADMLELMRPPYPVMISEQLSSYLNVADGDYIPLGAGELLGPIKVDVSERITGSRLIADMSLLRTLNRSSGFDMVACAEMPADKLDKLRAFLPNGISLHRNTRVELGSLTKAFHMNLTAMGMLSFLIGLFIFYQAMSLSFTQRQPLVGILRLTGVSGWQLTKALLIEIFGWILVGWLSGTVLGLALANRLMPSVSASLSDLYNADVGLSIEWQWEWSQYSLLMAILGCLLACFWPLVRLVKSQPIRLASRLSLIRFAGREFTLQALVACVCIVIAVALYQVPTTQEQGFTLIALLLVSVGFIMPYFLWRLFTSFSFTMPWVKVRWFFSDIASSMSYRGIAAMAFMLALATNIGVETMVGSFRQTTDQWLVQRLSADLYITPTASSAARMGEWLQSQDEVDSVWWRWEKSLQSDNGSIQVVSSGDSDSERHALTVKLAVPQFWYKLHNGKGVMISESMSLKQNLHPGDHIILPEPLGHNWQVLGVYYDYGNPYNQVIISQKKWTQLFRGSGDVALGVLLGPNESPENLIRRIQQRFSLSQNRIYNNNAMHTQAMIAFDQTFKVANTLGKITLFIAVFGLFVSTVAGEVARQKQVALLRCLGISGKELVILGALQLLVIGLFTAFIALPLGIILAQLMVDVVLKNAFGWTMQIELLPERYLFTFGWSLMALFVAGAWPVWLMVKTTPMKLLRDSL
ncbi:ABC transporter permease [Vibrio casei]|uniref:ABC transporter permease n=1 Tax=Vibrio casei TaxID=673372 RepID=A0A368LMI2_9VIBR|nr:FtsX-like permease family protein [Vibrio casei]RCS73104.1 ABC transporter permease [Vibrio casei]SJN40855.1 AttF component of AttEFGH ABC transport system / AttG component of AttEFGH ABC transport system [Vibrio casei]